MFNQKLEADADEIAWTASFIKKFGKRTKIQFSAYSEQKVSDVALAVRLTSTIK
jgi:hypothetical protein